MDSNDGYIKLETTQDKVRKLWAKIAVRAREQAFVQQVLAKKRLEDAQEIKK